MATLKQRIKKKNSSGTYDTLHIETNSNLVLMDNGNTLQYEMYAHTHTTGQISNFPSTMTPSYHTHSTGDIWNFPSTMAPSWHQHYASDILNLPAGLQMKSGNYTGNDTNGRYINIGVTAKFCFIISSANSWNDSFQGALLVQSYGLPIGTINVGYRGYGILSGTNIILYKGSYGCICVNSPDYTYRYFAFY